MENVVLFMNLANAGAMDHQGLERSKLQRVAVILPRSMSENDDDINQTMYIDLANGNMRKVDGFE